MNEGVQMTRTEGAQSSKAEVGTIMSNEASQKTTPGGTLTQRCRGSDQALGSIRNVDSSWHSVRKDFSAAVL